MSYRPPLTVHEMFGVAPDSPEGVALAATRAAHGLPLIVDPEVYRAEPTVPAGHYDRTDKLGPPGASKEA